MPYEAAVRGPIRIAVIGAGISGMGAAYKLSQNSHVTLFEGRARLGGHARTITAGKRGDQPVDTGFIVFNRANYPHLCALFEELGVDAADSNMSFGVSIGRGRFEYAIKTLDSLWGQRRNIVDPRFAKMLADILKFNKMAERLAIDSDMTIGDLLAKMNAGKWFRDYYLLPFSGAIWSTPTQEILDFPATAMVRFFRNHALLGVSGQHQWYTVRDGSRSYVDRLGAALNQRGVDLRLKAPVQGVRRVGGVPSVRTLGGEWEDFDHVIFATHADRTLSLLEDPSSAERAALGKVRYQPNRAVLHADEAVMPKRKRIWSSWNYTEPQPAPGKAIGVTYWMNSLQPIPKDDPLFLTLNATQPIREELIHDETVFRHPMYDHAMLEAQAEIREFNGTQQTWFCGAWMRNGFHEDGLASAVDVVRALEPQLLRVAA